MTEEKLELESEEESESGYYRTNETFSPVVVTEGIGTVFLGLISIILIAAVGVLLSRNRQLEDRIRELGD
jgi:hypothetical protein